MTRALAFGAAGCIVFGTVASGQSATQQQDAFSVLKHKTGWVELGLLRRGEDGLFNVEHGGKSFEILGRESKLADLPRVHDRIRATRGWDVWILNYSVTGEQERLVSPETRQTTTRRVDCTGLIVLPGTVVDVQDIQISKPYGALRAVWARVAPAP